jgi:hypothetical protein
MGQRGNIMKKLILIILFISFPLYAQNPFMASDGRGPYKDSNCDQAKYYPIGKLCADTDDGKLYKGTGAAVSEIAAGSSGDVAGPAASTAGEVVLFDGITGKIIKRSNTLSGFPQLTSGILSAKDAENTRTDLGLGALSTVTPGANVATFLATPNSSNFFGMISDEGNFISTLWDDADASTARTTLGLAIGTNVQAYDADLTTWAGITQGSGVGTFLATPSSANFFSMVTGETGSGAVVGGTAPGFTTSANPASADGATLGTTALEWSDIYFADGGVIYGQNDQSATLTSSASLWTANNFSVTTQFKLPSSNADPTATAGYFRHDSTITNFTNGGLVYYNGAAIKQVVDMTTATAQACTDDQVVAYDADNDLWYCKTDSTGAGASGTLTTIKEATAQVGGADIVTLDFGAGFDLTESPDTEINIELDLSEYAGAGLLPQDKVAGMSSAGTANPGFSAYDSDLLGADKFAGSIHWNGITLTDGAEDVDFWITTQQGGIDTTILFFDESDDQWETSKVINSSGGFTGALNGNATTATTATTANAGDSATSFFSSGTIEAARLPSSSTSTAGIVPSTNGVTDGYVPTKQNDGSVLWAAQTGGSGMTWPGAAGIAVYSGSSSWSTSLTTLSGLFGAITGEGTGVETALGNNANATGGFATVDGTKTFTNTTYSTAGTGNDFTAPLNGVFDNSITDPADADDLIYAKSMNAATITDIYCIAEGGGTITLTLQECDSAGANCGNIEGAITCDSDGAEDDGTLTDGNFAANGWIKALFSAPSGTVNSLAWSVKGTQVW